MNTVRGDTGITLAGPPHSTWAVVQLEPAERVVPIALKLVDGPGIYKAHVRPVGAGTSEIRLRLPRATPPGTYSGEGTFGGRLRDVAVEVEAVVKLRMQPKESTFAAEPGSRTAFDVDLANRGNVPFDIPDWSAIDLDDDEGHDRALSRTLRADLGPDERRVDRFFEELRADHGGEARVHVRTGAGRLEAAESRTLSCLLELPDTVRVGRTYSAAWSLGNIAHLIEVEVTKDGLGNRGRGTP